MRCGIVIVLAVQCFAGRMPLRCIIVMVFAVQCLQKECTCAALAARDYALGLQRNVMQLLRICEEMLAVH